MYKYPLPLIGVVLVLLTVALVAWQFVSIKSTGIPHGTAMRLSHSIVQIIRTTERYLPTLHRNPDKDRFRLDLLVISLDDPTKQEMITLIRQQDRNALQPMTKILGGDRNVVWVQALDLFAVNLETKGLLRLSDLKNLNPELEGFLTSARFDFEARLIAVSPDRQRAYAFPADSFKATPCLAPRRIEWPIPSTDVNDWLCAGMVFTPGEWFGALTAKDLTNNYKPGGWLPADFPVNPKAEARHLYRGPLSTDEVRPRFPELEQTSKTEYRDAAFIRSARGKAALRLSAPDSALLTYRSAVAPKGTLRVARIHPSGQVQWTVDTGIGTLSQVLPDPNVLAFIGERPLIPNKVSEPILVCVNTTTGTTNTISLWR